LEKKLSKITKVLLLKGDVSQFAHAKRIVDKTEKEFGGVDVLINNAGIHIDSTVNRMKLENWKKVINTNLGGTFNFCKLVLPIMQKQNYGRIINISSFTSFRGIAGASNYSASKAGIISFSNSLAKEIAKYNITVNCLAPGYFDIGMFDRLENNIKKEIVENIPAKRLGDPNEISELINLLISTNYLTGQVFVLDGGFSI